MKIVFRVDASIQIGTGHVMRCLTLADALKNQGAECFFICREHPGNLISSIIQRGHHVDSLPYIEKSQQLKQNQKIDDLAHSAWLGTTQKKDADLCVSIIKPLKSDWLIIDHYALDIRWEQELRPYCKKLMVIDDLADRHHHADMILDSGIVNTAETYIKLNKITAKILIGSEYALLRPEFRSLREKLEKKQKSPVMDTYKILINLGGVDKDNLTLKVLETIENTPLHYDVDLKIIMGGEAPWKESVIEKANKLQYSSQVLINVSNMAELMSNSDFAIGAAGSTVWERCCLGLPTIMISTSDNQRVNAKALGDSGAVISLDQSEISTMLASELQKINLIKLAEMREEAYQITDGYGTSRVIQAVLNFSIEEVAMIDEVAVIKIRALELSDIDEEYIKWFQNNDGHLDYFTGSGRSFNKNDLLLQFEQSLIDKKNIFLIIETLNDEKIGSIRIGPIDKRNQTSDLVCMIGNRNFLGKGLATEAIKIASAMAFNDFGIHRLHSGMIEPNIPSIKAYTKAGWSIEATMKDYYYTQGKRQSRICVSYINPRSEKT